MSEGHSHQEAPGAQVDSPITARVADLARPQEVETTSVLSPATLDLNELPENPNKAGFIEVLDQVKKIVLQIKELSQDEPAENVLEITTQLQNTLEQIPEENSGKSNLSMLHTACHAIKNRLTFLISSAEFMISLKERRDDDPEKAAIGGLYLRALKRTPKEVLGLIEWWKRIGSWSEASHLVTISEFEGAVDRCFDNIDFDNNINAGIELMVPELILLIALNELVTNSKQAQKKLVAKEGSNDKPTQDISDEENVDPAKMKKNLDFRNKNLSFSLQENSLVITYRDRAGGFEKLNIAPGKTTREGGTGTGMRLVHQLVEEVLGGEIAKDNWQDEHDESGIVIGAEIRMIIPLQEEADSKTDQPAAAAPITPEKPVEEPAPVPA